MFTGFDVDEGGEAVVSALNNPEQYNGKFIPLAGTHAPIQEYVDTFARVTGKKTKFVEAPRGSFGEEIQHNLDWFSEYTYYGPGADLSIGKKAAKLSSWEEWLKAGNWEK